MAADKTEEADQDRSMKEKYSSKHQANEFQ